LEALAPTEIVGLRFLIGVPLLLLIVRIKGIPMRFGSGELKAISIGSGIIAIHFLMQTYGLLHTSATKTAWLVGVSPLALALLSYLILGERIGRWEAAGIGVATVGILLLIYNGDFQNFGWLRSLGDVIMLISAFTWAVYTIVSRDLSRKHSSLPVTVVMFTPVTIVAVALMAVRGPNGTFIALSGETALALLFLAVPGMLAQWVWQEGVARLGAAKAGIFLYLEPVATTALAVPILGETPTVFTIGGGAMALLGVWIAERTRQQQQ
jgi:drug/metabolite transporter (DMT)-like permease